MASGWDISGYGVELVQFVKLVCQLLQATAVHIIPCGCYIESVVKFVRAAMAAQVHCVAVFFSLVFFNTFCYSFAMLVSFRLHCHMMVQIGSYWA